MVPNDPHARATGRELPADSSGSAHPWLPVRRELVISLSNGPRLLLCAIDVDRAPVIEHLLDAARSGAAPPRGRSRWQAEWSDGSLSAMRFSAQFEPAASVVALRLPLPRCRRTLGAIPQRVAVTDEAGLDEMQRSRALPYALLLPPATTSVLTEHLL